MSAIVASAFGSATTTRTPRITRPTSIARGDLTASTTGRQRVINTTMPPSTTRNCGDGETERRQCGRGRVADEHATLGRRQWQPLAQAGGDAGEHEAVGHRQDREDKHGEPCRTDDVEVEVVLAERVDGGAQHHEETEPEQRAAEPAGWQIAADDEVQRRGRDPAEDSVEQYEADGSVDSDLADNLLGLGDPPLGVIAGRHREEAHGEPAPGADHRDASRRACGEDE